MFDFILSLSQTESIIIPITIGIILFSISFVFKTLLLKSNAVILINFQSSCKIFSEKLFESLDRTLFGMNDITENYFYTPQLYYDSFGNIEAIVSDKFSDINSALSIQLNQYNSTYLNLLTLNKEYVNFKISEMEKVGEIFTTYCRGSDNFNLNHINPQNIHLRSIAFLSNALQIPIKQTEILKLGETISEMQDASKQLKIIFLAFEKSFNFYNEVNLKPIQELTKYVFGQIIDSTTVYFRNIYNYYSDYLDNFNKSFSYFTDNSNIYLLKILYMSKIQDFKINNKLNPTENIFLVTYKKDSIGNYFIKELQSSYNFFIRNNGDRFELVGFALSNVHPLILTQIYDIDDIDTLNYIISKNPLCSSEDNNVFRLTIKGKLK